MIALQHSETGEVQIVASLDGVGSEWAQIDPPPAPDGWRWDDQASAWQPYGPRLWSPLNFQRVLLTPEEVVAFDQVEPLLPAAPALRFAVIVARSVAVVDLDNPTTLALLEMGVAAGVLTPARAARIQAGLPPL